MPNARLGANATVKGKGGIGADSGNAPSVEAVPEDPNAPLTLDFTAGVPAKLTPTARTGGNLFLSRSSSSPVAVVQAAGSQGVYEDRGGGIKGIWTFPAYANELTSPLDMTNAAWTKSNATMTAGVAAPDGSNNAQRIGDSSGATRATVFQQGANGSFNRAHSYWVKNGPSAPTVDGGVNTDGSGTYGASNASSASWKRVTAWGFGVQTRAHIPAGFLPGTRAGNPAVVFTDSATGEADYWGHTQVQNTTVDYPGCETNTGAQDYRLLQTADLSKVINGGDLDIELRIWSTHISLGISAYPSGYIFSAQSPDGLIAIHFANPNFTFVVRGVTVATVQMAGFSTGKNLHIRFQYKPSLGTYRCRVGLNGCYQLDAKGNTTGGALAAVTSFYLGSNVGANHGAWLFESVRFPVGEAVAKINAEFIVLGDSIWGSYVNLALSGAGIYTGDEYKTRRGIISIAVGGDNIEGQQSKFLASEYAGAGGANVLAASFMVGANDLINQLDSESTMRTQYQAFVDAMKTSVPTLDVVACKMSPFHGALDAGKKTIWENLNESLAGNTNPITNVDARVTSHVPILGDAGNILRTEYSYDGLHPTDNG